MSDSYDHEDVPGAAEAARATLARDYAMQRLAAQLDDTEPAPLGQDVPKTATATGAEIRALAVQAAEHGAQYAGLTLSELDIAELEIRRVYLNEPGREYLLTVARQHLALLQAAEPAGPGPDAVDHRRSDGEPLR